MNGEKLLPVPRLAVVPSCGPNDSKTTVPPQPVNVWPVISLGVGLLVVVLELWNGLAHRVWDAYAVPELDESTLFDETDRHTVIRPIRTRTASC